MTPLFITFTEDGKHIRKWSREWFEGSICYKPEVTVTAREWMRVTNVSH